MTLWEYSPPRHADGSHIARYGKAQSAEQVSVLFLQISHIISGVEVFPGGVHEKFTGGFHFAVLMDVVPQIFADHRNAALAKQRVHIHEFFHVAVELGADGAAQGVGWEIADGALGPVDVLEDALGVVCGAHA